MNKRSLLICALACIILSAVCLIVALLGASSAADGKFTMFADSGNADSPWAISNIDANSLPKTVKLQPRGGFVIAEE